MAEGRGVLFPAPTEPRVGALGGAEPKVHWYMEMTRPEAVDDRETINRRYVRFPDRDGRLAIRIRSEDDAQHESALSELLVYQLLTLRHEDVRHEEEDGAPDFRVYKHSVLIGSVEVLTLLQKDLWEREEGRYGRLADALNLRLRVRGYMIHVVEIEGGETPPGRLARHVARFLEGLPSPQEVSAAFAQGMPLPTTEHQGKNGRVVIEAIPLREGASANDDPEARIVGMGPVIGGLVDSAHRLRNALHAKRASRYTLGDAPYVLAISNRDPFCSMVEWMNALYGPDQLSLRPDDPVAKSLDRDRHGYFGRDPFSGRIRAEGLAAAVVLEQRLISEGLQSFRLDNPEARTSPDDRFFPYSRRFRQDDLGEWSWMPTLEEPEHPVRLA